MEMHEIRYFLALCRTLNFHRAAEAVHVSQPALTRAIQKLESELGAHLFQREKGRVQITEFGTLMRSHLQDVMHRSETAQHAARSFLKLEAASLKLGVMCTIGPLRFIGFLNEFRGRHSEMEVSVVEGAANRLAKMLLDGDLDVALLAKPGPFDSGFTAHPLYKERFGLAFAAGHPLESRDTLSVFDVEGESYLDRTNCEFADHIDELCARRGITITTAYRSEREDWILAMVAAGMGVCFIAEYSATLPGIKHRVVSDPEIVREVSVVSASERTLPSAVDAFVRASREYAWNGA
jgi:LysR family transcriptional regulator, hydrogen peroxide-inducible genes activator